MCAAFRRYMDMKVMEVGCVHCEASVPITHRQESSAEWDISQGARALEIKCAECGGSLKVTFRDPPRVSLAQMPQMMSAQDDEDALSGFEHERGGFQAPEHVDDVDD